MKRLILLVSMIVTLAFSMVAFAAGDGSVLNNEQKSAEKVLSVATTSTLGVESLNGILSPDIAKKMDATAVKNLQKTVTDKFGTMKDSKLVAFERFDKADRVIYLLSFSKEKFVQYIVIFNKDTKPLINEFGFRPVQPQAPAAPAKK